MVYARLWPSRNASRSHPIEDPPAGAAWCPVWWDGAPCAVALHGTRATLELGPVLDDDGVGIASGVAGAGVFAGYGGGFGAGGGVEFGVGVGAGVGAGVDAGAGARQLALGSA